MVEDACLEIWEIAGSNPTLAFKQGTNFEFCVWRAVLSHSYHHPQEVLLAQFSLYVNKGGLKPHLFHFNYNSSIFGISRKPLKIAKPLLYKNPGVLKFIESYIM